MPLFTLPPTSTCSTVAFSPRDFEEDEEVDGLFAAYEKDGIVPMTVLAEIAGNCSPFKTALVDEEESDHDEPLRTPHSARSVPEEKPPLERVLTKVDLKQILLADSDHRRISNARWISHQKHNGAPKEPQISLPGASEEDRRDKFGPKVPKHLRIDELNLNELDDDAEFERIKRELKGGDATVLTSSSLKTRALVNPHDSVDVQNANEGHRDRMTSVRNLSLAPLSLSESEQHLHRLQTQLHNIKALQNGSSNLLPKCSPSAESLDIENSSMNGAIHHSKSVNAAILSELFSKHHPKKHTVDDVLLAIKREEAYAHGWEDQRRKPNSTVLFVGQKKLARRAQHGFMLPDIEEHKGAKKNNISHPLKGHSQSDKTVRSTANITPLNRKLPEWKQAWLMLSKSQRDHSKPQPNKAYKHVAGTGLAVLAQERPYHLTPMQRMECHERAVSSMEIVSRPNMRLASVASQALSTLTNWRSTEMELSSSPPRSRSVPPEVDSTAYARLHYASHWRGQGRNDETT